MYGKDYHDWCEEMEAKDACEREIILAMIRIAKRYDHEVYEAACNAVFPPPPKHSALAGLGNGLGAHYAAQQLQQRMPPPPGYDQMVQAALQRHQARALANIQRGRGLLAGLFG